MSNAGRALGALMKGRELGEMKRCLTCDKFDWTGIHECPPKWEAILNNYHDEDEPGFVFSDGDAENAAVKFANEHFGDWDYPSEMQIWVRKDEDDPWRKFDVTVESVPMFSAVECGK